MVLYLIGHTILAMDLFFVLSPVKDLHKQRKTLQPFCFEDKYSVQKGKKFIEPAAECAGSRGMILNISQNPDLAEMEIHKIRVKNRNLRCQLACVVTLEAMEKDGAVFPDDVAGNRIEQAVRIKESSISNALQSGSAP
jgi:hypothetical protein